ncbi:MULTISPECIES: helicase-related protein [Rhodococcus]|uniref:helicase-related protein n=1 Tax=Rhodococcus TaxID=1827 RepID=UPI00193B099F|nr:MULTISPECIES: helicase-related protein [Rhodococcus]QRI79237.1 DEAD/DEAH box helicase family protein [Rhodococcus aetherivorans]QSE62421.1 DEAD/DEAH box helicase family protein [Rhodococcus sp. PSBB066]
MTEHLERLRGQWRELRGRENQLRSELHALGIDPEGVPRKVVREVASAQPAWREHPATRRQLRALERIARETDVPFVVDEGITKGRAHDLIASLLAGNLPQAQFTDRPAGPMLLPAATPTEPAAPDTAPAPEPHQAETPQRVIDPVAEVERRLLETLAEPDAEADAAANPEVNTAAQFFSWADGHFKVKTQVALADLMTDRQSLTDEMFVVCRAILADPKRWGELGHRAAEAYWQARTGEPVQHPVIAEVTDAIVDARAREDRAAAEDFLDTTQHVLDAQERAELATAEQRSGHVEAVQDGIDQAATVEVEQWWARGRAAYDPGDPLNLPQPDTDPQVAAALEAVRRRKARDEIRAQWFAGVEQGRREATAEERQALVAEVAVDPRLIATVEGRRPDYLPAVARSAAQSLIAEAAREASPLRQAAAKVLLEHHPLPAELYERAYAEWDRLHGPELTWDQATAVEWTAWMTLQLRRDPLVGSWAGLPMWTRTDLIEFGIETAFAVMAEERPDLIAATAGIPTERLAAELRGNIIPNLPQPQASDVSALFVATGEFRQLRLQDYVESRVQHYTIHGWAYTLDGGSTSTTAGHNPRVAIGALLDARNIEIPEWIERIYRPYAQARATVVTRAIAYARNNEFHHAAARSDLLWKYDESGSFVAAHSLLEDVRRGIIEQLRSDVPAEVELLESLGVDLEWTLGHDVDPTVLREIRAAGEDLYSLTPTDLTFAGAGDVVVGDPDGRHITIRSWWAPNSSDHITYVDRQPRPALTMRDAIADARAVLAAESQVEPEPLAEAAAEVEADAETTSVEVDEQSTPTAEAEQPATIEEVPPPSPRVVAPAVDDTGAVIFEEVESAPTEPSAPAGPDTAATSWMLTDPLAVGHIGPTATPTPAPEPEPETAPEPEAAAEPAEEAAQTEPVAAADELVVPNTEYGEPLTSPLWRGGGLVKARKESGGYVYLSPATAAQYAAADASAEPQTTVEQPQRETTAAAAVERPGAVAETSEPAPQIGGVQAHPDTDTGSPVVRPAPPTVEARDFTLGADVLVPSGAKARARANIAALRLVRRLDEQQRPATAAEQAVLAQWSGWGAIPEVFDHRAKILAQWGDEHAELLDLLGDKGFAQARATTLNAHYTDPAIVAELWRAAARAGLPDGALVLEPGCGAGHFVGIAPASVRMVGVEIEPISAKIAHYLYPSQQIRNHGFERNFAPENTFTGAIGNVPFGKFAPVDPIHNPGGLSIHNHFIAKSLALTAPGGYVAVVTSMFTSDAKRAEQRAAITAKGDLIGAVRLPTGAFDRQAGTDVVTDVLIFRRREDGAAPTEDTLEWAQPAVQVAAVDAKTGETTRTWINPYFAKYPERVLGTLTVGGGMYAGGSLRVTPHPGAALAEQLRTQLDPIVDRAVARGLGFTAQAPDPVQVEAFTTPGLRTGAGLDSNEVLPGAMRFNEAENRFEQFTLGRGWAEVGCRGKDLAEQWKVLIALGETVMELSEASRSRTHTVADRDGIRGRLNSLYDGYVRRWGPLNRFKLTDPTPLSDEKIAARLDKAITEWRIKTGRDEAIADGLDPTGAGPYTGSIPDEVYEELREKAAEQPQPRRYSAHLQGAIARDPRLGMVLAIENFQSRFDGSEAVATKTAIFTEDTTPFKDKATAAADLDEALAICFDELGHIAPHRMAELLNLSVEDTLDQAQGRIYPSLHADGQWELAAVALSGQVRDKLAFAQVKAGEDPRYASLVQALESVVPADVDPADIGVRIGATWVPIEDYRAFLVEEFGLRPDRLTVEHDAISGSWEISTDQKSRHEFSSGYPDKYGTGRLPGVKMFELLANNKPIQVTKTADELERSPKPRFHVKLTEQAQASAAALQERFEKWLWEDGDRYLRLARIFNERYNSFVKPVHDGRSKTFPGLNPKYTPYDYQAAAVQRFLHDETILLDHVVGAGKTLTITASCMEATRLGQIRQPWIVVPNHLLAQWAVEARDAYPNANILVAADLDGRDDRQRFVGQSAVGDWDLVIVPQSVFGKIAMRREAQIDYLESELAELRQALDAANSQGAEFTVKQIENAIKAAEGRIEKIIDAKATDDGLTFEQSGCDFLFVDEAHDYKNLTRPSNSADLSVPTGSQRATDLEMKAKYLREQARARGAEQGMPHAPAKAIAFATGTPITNSLSEIWVMTKYLRPDLLHEAGLGRIDNWAGTFAKPVSVAEMNATATRIQMRTRMAEYANVPQLVAMFDQFRDVVTADRIPVRLPTLDGGTPQIVEFDMGPDAVDAMADLDVRMGMIQGDRMDLDNSLKIATDGRNLTMHPSLANLAPPEPEHNRIEHAAELIWQVHTENADLRIPADKYGPEMTGVFQLVFCDRGTPKAGAGPRARNLYTELRDALVTRGMQPDEIAFMHDYEGPKAKARLVEACADGRIRVLLTSTKKGGTGLNVQRALKQMINLDPAWTAADMEQRLGRIIRQGNVHESVRVVNMVARRSFDAMMYQYVARKSNFVAMIRKADVPPTMEDLGGDLTVSWAQSKAAATGDPVFVAQVEADQQVAELEARRDAVLNANAARSAAIRALSKSITTDETRLPEVRAMVDKLTAWTSIDDRAKKMWHFPHAAIPDSETADLADALRGALIRLEDEVTRSNDEVVFGAIGGVPLKLGYTQVLGQFYVCVGEEIAWYERDRFLNAVEKASGAQGMLTTLRNLAEKATRQVPVIEARIEHNRGRLADAEAEPELDFTDTAELEAAKLRAEELRLEVNARENSPEALRRAREDQQRRAADGQYPQWTLDLNPTDAWAEHRNMSKADLIASVPARMAAARQEWLDGAEIREANRKAQPWVALDDTEAIWQYGFDPGSGRPGARVYWDDRQWHLEAWDGDGALDRHAVNTRGEAFSIGIRAVETFAADHKIPREAIHQAGIERRERRDNAASPTTVEPTAAVVEPADAIVEPTETISAATGTFELDDTLAHGLRAAGDVRPLHKFNPHGTRPQQQQHIDPMQQYEAEYGGGYEEDGRAV